MSQDRETIAEQEFQAWKLHPMTQALQRWANLRRERLKEAWAEGGYSAQWSLEMAVKNAGATGACSIYKEFMELSYEDIEEALNGE